MTDTKRARVDRPNTGEDWRALGFYHHPDTAQREWYFTGSRSGLGTLVRMLRSQAEKANGPHHPAPLVIGPYEDLQIRVWERPGIDDESIHGPPDALRKLGTLIEEHLDTAAPGTEFCLHAEFTGDAEYGLRFSVQDEDFDPAGAIPVAAEPDDLDEDRTPIAPAVAFKFHDPNEYVTESMGLVRLEGGDLIMEFQTKDAILGVIKSDVKVVPVPLDMISSVRFKRSMFGAKIAIQARDMKTLAGVPGLTQGKVRLAFKRDVRDEAEVLANAIQELIGGSE